MGISDHDLIFVVRKQKIPKPKARTIEFRTLKNMDQNAFLADLNSAPWDNSYIYDNIDDIWSHWSDLYKQILDDHAPVKRIKLRNNQLPWVSPDIQMQIRKRNRLYKKFRRTPTDLNWSNYKVQRNRVTALKKKAVKENTGLNVTQNSYNSKFRHNSYSFVISRIWNKLPPSVKIAPNLSSFRRKLKTLIFTGCQCKSCL